MGKHSTPGPLDASPPSGRPEDGTPETTAARRHGATDRTMAAAAAAAAATAAVAALPPMTSSAPSTGRRARRAAGNPYAPGGPQTAVTGSLPTVTGAATPTSPVPAPPATRAPAPAAPAQRTPAPWHEPLAPAPGPASAEPADLTDLGGFPELPRTAPKPPKARRTPKTPMAPMAPMAPKAAEVHVAHGMPVPRLGRSTVIAAAVAVVALATTVAVVVQQWPLGGAPSADVSLSSNPSAGPQATPSAGPSPAAVPSQSALPAVTAPVRPKLGVFRGTSTSDVRSFEKWSGAKVDYVMDYSARDTWQEIADPQYMLDEWEDSGYRPVYAVAMLPLTGVVSMQAGARGEYDRYFRELARNLVANDQEDAILRVGWEFNVSVSKWRVRDSDTFKAYWRNIVTAMRSVDGQKFEFDWNVNASNTEIDASSYWPGDEYVDYVGVDVYDLGWEVGTYPYPANCDATCRLSRQQAAWDEIYGGDRGLAFWSDFAKKHGKPMTLPEWGLWQRDDGHGGGDNPFFIEKMHAFISDPAHNIAYQGYFDVDTDDGQIHALTSMKAAGAVYRKLFR
jgi:hypothetical protein